MPTYQNRIELAPEALHKAIAAMTAEGRLPDFAMVLLRLIDLFSRYTTEDTPEDRRRTASLFGDPRSVDCYWYIHEQPRDRMSPNQDDTTLLAGGLHFHRSDNTWTINT